MNTDRMLFLKAQDGQLVVRVQRPPSHYTLQFERTTTYRNITPASSNRLEYIIRRAAIVRHVILTSGIFIYAHFIARLPDEPPVKRVMVVPKFQPPNQRTSPNA